MWLLYEYDVNIKMYYQQNRKPDHISVIRLSDEKNDYFFSVPPNDPGAVSVALFAFPFEKSPALIILNLE